MNPDPLQEAEVDLYSLTLCLSSVFDDAEISVFSTFPCDEACIFDGNRPLSGMAARENNDHRSDWRLTWLFDGRPDPGIFSELLNIIKPASFPSVTADLLTLESVPHANWLAQSYRQFEPFHESGFYIFGSHIDSPSPGADIPMQIDAATAFGSGEHGTTAGCLSLMQGLKAEGFSPVDVLDLGTGSGILGIAAWKLWKTQVTATDIDTESIRVATHHRDINHVPAEKFTCIESNGFAAQTMQQNHTYALVIANILAGPLREMAGNIVYSCRSGGYIILSGMLCEQAQELIDLYCGLGCSMEKKEDRDPWTSLLLRKN